MKTKTRTILAIGAAALSLGPSCATKPDPVAVVVPTTATTQPSYQPDGAMPSRRYVVRMSNGSQDWEVEFPEVASGYEMRLPLDDPSRGPDVRTELGDLTEADKEFLETLSRRNAGVERDGIYVNGANQADPDGSNQLGNPDPGAELGDGAGQAGVDPFLGTEDRPAPSRQSYFLGIDKVKRLYRAQEYEAAIVLLTKLNRMYPRDPQLLSMTGTVYLQLGNTELARRYWEQTLKVQPSRRDVIEALKQLNLRTGQPGDQGASPGPTNDESDAPPAP
ncbi:MAG: hypothetical protein AAGI01_06105 [Myxococcota bacterium]